MAEAVKICALCRRSLSKGGQLNTLGKKGSESLNKASKLRGDTVATVPGQRIHEACRSTYLKPDRNFAFAPVPKLTRQLSANDASVACSDGELADRTGREKNSEFNFKTHCLMCGTKCMYKPSRRIYRYMAMVVDHTKFIESINRVLDWRKDNWAEAVLARLQLTDDLRAAGAYYHTSCLLRFRTKKAKLPARFREPGEPEAASKATIKREQQKEANLRAFMALTEYMEENDKTLMSMDDLVSKMQQFMRGNGHEDIPCGNKHFKMKLLSWLLEHYGNKIVITEHQPRARIVAFKTTVDLILSTYHTEQQRMAVGMDGGDWPDQQAGQPRVLKD